MPYPQNSLDFVSPGSLQEMVRSGWANEREMLDALQAAMRLIDIALPQFNWDASALDAASIRLLNEVPAKVRRAIDRQAVDQSDAATTGALPMSDQHTPARPWVVEPTPGQQWLRIRGANGGHIAHVYNSESNAQLAELLRAAPETAAERDRLREHVVLLSASLKRADAVNDDLAAALGEVVAFWDSITMEDCVNDIHVRARAAIARAKA